MKTLGDIRIGVIGDDMTGVNAVVGEAAMFGIASCVTSVDASPPEFLADNLQVWGINLATRDHRSRDDCDIARRQTERLLAWGADHILFKIDSLWRGDPELLICCACRFGPAILYHGSAPVSALRRQNQAVNVQVVPETNPLLALQDLRQHARQGNKLWVGSVGLLKSILWSHVTNPVPLAIVVGTYQENVAQQVDALREFGATVFDLPECVGWPVGPGKVAKLQNRLLECWNRKTPIVIRTIVGAPADGQKTSDKHCAEAGAQPDRAEIYFALCAELLKELLTTARFGLVLTGGHTADSVLTSLGLKSLVFDGHHIAAGAPIARPANAASRERLVVTKPGHYGGADALADIAMYLQIFSEVSDSS